MSFKKKTFKKMAHKNKRQFNNKQYQPQRNSSKKNTTFPTKNQSLLGRIKRTYPSNGNTTITRKPKKFPRVNPKSTKQKRNNVGTQTISFKAGQSTGMRLDGVKVTHIDPNKQAAKRGVKIGWIVKQISGHPVDPQTIKQILARVGKTNNLVFTFEKPTKRRKMILAKDHKKKIEKITDSKNVARIDDSQTLERITNVEDVDRVTDPKDVDILIKEFEEQFGEELRPFHQEQPPLNGQCEKVDAFLEYMETFIKREMRICGLA